MLCQLRTDSLMPQARDLLLLAVILISILLGLLFPEFFRPLRPLPIYCLFALFFLSYLPIEMEMVLKGIKESTLNIVQVCILKVVVFPIIIWLAFDLFFPKYSTAALLLTAISTGVTAPFIAGLVGANTALVLTVVVITSLLVPFTLPLLIKLLLARSTVLPIADMIQTLALVVFIPVLIVEGIRKTMPRLLSEIMKIKYPASLALFGVTNIAIFSQYAVFFHREPAAIGTATILAFSLSMIYLVFGIMTFRKHSLEDKLAGAVIFANINNVMVLVFASRFFGAMEAIVAAIYNIPYFGIILLMRIYTKHYKRNT